MKDSTVTLTILYGVYDDAYVLWTNGAPPTTDLTTQMIYVRGQPHFDTHVYNIVTLAQVRVLFGSESVLGTFIIDSIVKIYFVTCNN